MDHFEKIDNRDFPVTCPHPDCGQMMTRELSAPMVRGDYEGYSCPRTGKWIEGRRAHEENLKLHGCRVFEPGEKRMFDENKRRGEAAFNAKIENTVEELIHAMPLEKRESLAIDLQNGANVEVVRGSEPPT
jgi:hypothetical protein